jgi:hypothetical protein
MRYDSLLLLVYCILCFSALTHADIYFVFFQSMAIAKKLWRQRNRGMASPWSKKSRLSIMVEEKKSE